MEYCKVAVLLFFVFFLVEVSAYELPVQLFGFPAITASMRAIHFLRSLVYSLTPATYRSRTRRELSSLADPFEVQDVEKYIVGEYGERACVFERVCARYATGALSSPPAQIDFKEVFSQYKRSTDQAKELYLLSVFLGDIVGSPQLCHQLAKRRGCNEALLN